MSEFIKFIVKVFVNGLDNASRVNFLSNNNNPDEQ